MLLEYCCQIVLQEAYECMYTHVYVYVYLLVTSDDSDIPLIQSAWYTANRFSLLSLFVRHI